MAVMRDGRMHRRVGDTEATAMRVAQSQASIRKLERKLAFVGEREQYSGYREFVIGSIHDVGRSGTGEEAA